MNWAKEVAKKIIEERPNEEVYTVASGVSPSGFVHIGNFREIATPYLVAKELRKLGKKVRYILSFDEFDRFRKVPGNIDSSYEKYIGMPYTEIPSPFTENESYASYMENRFLNELKAMDVDVEWIIEIKFVVLLMILELKSLLKKKEKNIIQLVFIVHDVEKIQQKYLNMII